MSLRSSLSSGAIRIVALRTIRRVEGSLVITATVASWIFTQPSYEILRAHAAFGLIWVLRLHGCFATRSSYFAQDDRLLLGDFGSIVLLLVMVPTKYLVQEPGFLVRGHG